MLQSILHCYTLLHSKRHFVFVLKTVLVKIFVLNFYPSVSNLIYWDYVIWIFCVKLIFNIFLNNIIYE